ncbi:MAG: DUF3592 domain-containing protein [Myxococcales bacterium]
MDRAQVHSGFPQPPRPQRESLNTSHLATVFCWGLSADAVIALNGRRVEGTLISASLNTSVEVNGRSPTTVRFAYEVDGARYENAADVSNPASLDLRPGAPVDLEVAVSHPEWARLAGETYASFGWGGLLSLIFPAVGLLILRAVLGSRRRQARVFESGRAATGVIVESGFNRRVREKGGNPYQVTWEFDVEGKEHRGAVSSLQAAELQPLTQGMVVCVLYDPDDPSRNTLYLE